MKLNKTYHVNGKKSFTKSFVLLWVLMLCLFSGSVIFGVIQESEIINEYDRFVEQGIKLSRLPMQMQQLIVELENYIVYNDENAYENYLSLKKEVENIFDEFGNVRGNEEYRFYYRTTLNIYTHINANAEKAANMFDVFYNPRSGIKVQSNYLVAQSEKLVLSYMKYISLHYRNVLEQYRNIIMIRNGILFAAAFLISSIWVLRRGSDLLKSMKEISKNALVLADSNWDIADMNESQYYEINNVILAFNTMKTNIKKNIEELSQKAEIERNYFVEKLRNAEKDKIIKETKLLALQMEINPHFLFNTMNTISRTALLEDTESTIKLVEAISNIMRYSLQAEFNSSTLAQELDAVKFYLNIQRLRFKNKLVFQLDIDANIKLDSILIPPLILQPIVENAIIHGMSTITTGGIIEILVTKKKDSVIICINDNGKGIKKEVLNRINNGELIRKRQEEKSMGIDNVKMRMKHYYNDNHLVSYNSVEGEGTSVCMRIPMEGVSLDENRNCRR